MVYTSNEIDGKCTVEVHIGRIQKISNLPIEWYTSYVKNAICYRIEYLVRLRSSEMSLGLGKPIDSCVAKQKLVRSFEKLRWLDIDQLADQILSNRNALLRFLPPPASATYKELSQIAFDLIIWAQSHKRL